MMNAWIARLLNRTRFWVVAGTACALLTLAMSGTAGTVERNAASQQQTSLPASLKLGILGAGWAPFEFVSQGEPSGLSVDYLRAVVGPQVKLEAHSFPDMPHLLAAACSGEVDVIMSIARTPERERCLAFSNPYFRAPIAIVKRRAAPGGASDTRVDGAILSVEKGFALERSLHDRYPHSPILVFGDTVSALRAVAGGRASAYAGFSPAVEYYLGESEFRDLSAELQDGDQTNEIRFAVPRTRIALRDQINSALAALPSGEGTMIRTRWLDDNVDVRPSQTGGRFTLSPDEKAWLRSLPPLAVGLDSDWAPFAAADPSGEPAGIATDYLDYLSRTLGVKFNRVPVKGRTQNFVAFQSGEINLMAMSPRSDLRPADAQIAHTYSGFPLMIVGRDDHASVQDLGELSGRRIAVTAHAEGAPLVSLLVPPAHRVVVDGVGEGLDAVANGDVDALIVNAAAIGGAIISRAS
jgi:two-component system, NarL family, sensor histidine kinase EvgS